MVAGLSTIGVKVGYGLSTYASNTETKPNAYTLLNRINAIGGLNLEAEQIDASALEDTLTRYIEGRYDTGGTFPITVNLTSETRAEWQGCIDAYKNRGNNVRMFFEVYHPNLDKAFFIVAAPPAQIPLPEIGQNELLTVEMNLTVEEYIGMDTPKVPASA